MLAAQRLLHPHPHNHPSFLCPCPAVAASPIGLPPRGQCFARTAGSRTLMKHCRRVRAGAAWCPCFARSRLTSAACACRRSTSGRWMPCRRRTPWRGETHCGGSAPRGPWPSCWWTAPQAGCRCASSPPAKPCQVRGLDAHACVRPAECLAGHSAVLHLGRRALLCAAVKSVRSAASAGSERAAAAVLQRVGLGGTGVCGC